MTTVPGEGAHAPPSIPLWVMLAALSAMFALTHAFRTMATIVAADIQSEFAVSAQALGSFAAAFHLAFGVLQLVMGVALDRCGPRRTVCAAFLIAVLGALICACAPSFDILVAGQVLIGVGCAPVFLATMVFVAKRYAADQFSSLSGLVLGLGGLGMLLTGTPLAWVVERWSWRAGFLLLAALSAITWLATAILVKEQPQAHTDDRETLAQSFRQIGAILVQRHTLGIVILGAVTYAAFITLRGLWVVPLLVTRHEFSLVQSGHVVLAMSIVTLFGPPIFGRLDPGGGTRRHWIVICTIAYASLFATLAFAGLASLDVGIVILSGFLAGFIVLQYADVRAAYPAQVAGRALAVFNMAMFLGVALTQWISGLVASVAAADGADPLRAVFMALAGLLAAAAVAFRALPRR